LIISTRQKRGLHISWAFNVLIPCFKLFAEGRRSCVWIVRREDLRDSRGLQATQYLDKNGNIIQTPVAAFSLTIVLNSCNHEACQPDIHWFELPSRRGDHPCRCIKTPAIEKTTEYNYNSHARTRVSAFVGSPPSTSWRKNWLYKEPNFLSRQRPIAYGQIMISAWARPARPATRVQFSESYGNSNCWFLSTAPRDPYDRKGMGLCYCNQSWQSRRVGNALSQRFPCGDGHVHAPRRQSGETAKEPWYIFSLP